MKPLILYKNHDNHDSNVLQSVVRFLYAKYKIDIRPINIIERHIPINIHILPTIFVDNRYIFGINDIVKFYENLFYLNNLRYNSIMFDKFNPNYRITDISTHRHIKF
jgi:hypothetical protein